MKLTETLNGPVRFVLVFAAAVSVVMSRRPAAVLNPQFWAEDGAVWYAQAYNNGILASLVTPEAGYLQSFSRLVAAFSLAFPFYHAPLAFNLIAICVQGTVAVFIVSDRCSALIPHLKWRLLLAFLYVALPHSSEVNANITNSQWHLALLSFLIVAARPDNRTGWKLFDTAVVLISALSGPVCIFLLPLAAWKYRRTREKRLILLMSVLLLASAVQTVCLLVNPRPTKAALGADVWMFMKITFRHIFVAPVIGQGGFHLIWERFGWNAALVVIVNLAGFSLAAYAFFKANLEFRLLIVLSALIYAAALVSPAATPFDGQWLAISEHNTSLRYWFIPGVCVVATLIFLASQSSGRVVRYTAAAVMLLLPIGVVKDWENPRFADKNFPAYAAEFERAAPGDEVVIPINPDWEMKLIKKQN